MVALLCTRARHLNCWYVEVFFFILMKFSILKHILYISWITLPLKIEKKIFHVPFSIPECPKRPINQYSHKLMGK